MLPQEPKALGRVLGSAAGEGLVRQKISEKKINRLFLTISLHTWKSCLFLI